MSVRSEPRRRFGLATAGATIVALAIYGLFVLTEPGQRLENLALMGAQLRGDAARDGPLGYLSQVNIVSYAAAILGLVAVAFVRRRLGLGALVALAMGGSVVFAELLKDLLPRPELVTGPAWILRNDFPSGHATVAASIGIGALLVAPDRLRWVVLPVGAVFAAVIGQSSQITGWHRMSSAAGGVALVVAAACAALVLLDRRGYVQPSLQGRVHPRLRTAILAVPAVAFVVAASALVLLVAFPLLQVPRDADSVFLHTVFELLGFGFTIVAFVAFAGLIEPFSLGRFERERPATVGPPGPPGPELDATDGDPGAAEGD
jgi:membrane-associated phospholipid phosphatase